MSRHHCGAHCRACDRCFSNVEAFDAHRQGPHEPGGRVCLSPGVDEEVAARFVAVIGVCKSSEAENRPDREVWALANRLKAFPALDRRPLRASEASQVGGARLSGLALLSLEPEGGRR